MTGNIALDVFIGLAFIYLLYSLYATVIAEIIASIFGFRAKNLQYAIKRMLTDDQKIALYDWIKGFTQFWFLKKRSNKEKETLFYKFFNQPTIKYLSKSGILWEKKPSYIAPHSFSKAIMDTLKNEGTGETLINRIKTGIDNCPIDENSRSHIKSLLEDANNDLQKFRLLLEQWFNDTMERSIGWYKRNNQFILFFLGLFMAITFNVNTLHIARLLSKDNKAREQLVTIATNDQNKYAEYIKNVQDTTADSQVFQKDYKEYLDSLNDLKKDLESDMSNTQILFGGGWNLPDKVIYSMKNDSLEKLNTKKYNLQFLMKDTLFIRNDTIFIHYPSDKFTVDSSIYIRSVRVNCVKNNKQEKQVQSYFFKPWKYKTIYAFQNFWGYLLTALAISLGAPFWFDLLNKLVKLRGSTRQTVTSESESATDKKNDTTSNNPLNRKG